MRSRPRPSKISAPADAGIWGRTKGWSASVTGSDRSRDTQPFELLLRRMDGPQGVAQQLHHVRLHRGTDEVLVLVRVVVEVEEEVRVDRVAPHPEREPVTGLEGLTDHRDVRPRHEVEAGPPVRGGQ